MNARPIARPWTDEDIAAVIAPRVRAAKVEALREAALLIYNGAPDPCQALYNYGANPWLNKLADEIERGDDA